MGGPFADLRVVDLTDDTGRFATKLLAEAGARVVRVHDGRHVSHGPAMVDPAAVARGGLLDWWYDGGKTACALDLSAPAGADAYRRLVAGADLVVETATPGRLAALGLDHADLVRDHPRLVQVSLTPFGRTGPWATWQTSDLVANAMGGVLSVSGTPEQAINPWGRQALNFGSFTAVIAGLSALRHARRTGAGQHVDVSLHEVVAATLEQLWFQYHYDDVLPLPKVAPRQGSLHWIRACLVTPCRTGWCMITPTPSPGPLLAWMAEHDEPGAAELLGKVEGDILQAIPLMDPIMDCVRSFALRHDSGWLWTEAQARRVAFGEVQTVAQVAANPQFAFRRFHQDTSGAIGVRRPRLPIVFEGTPIDPPAPPASATVDELLADWAPRRTATEPQSPRDTDGKPLAGLRVLDFTWVLAGPFACRMLGDLGADVVKVQTAGRATSVNAPEFPYFACWNRSKRSLAVDMKAAGAHDLVRTLIERSDVLVENFSAGVFARWGLDYETVRQWNPRIVYVSMSGPGHAGPWSSVLSYAPTVHALCGLTHLSNPPERGDVGAGFSLNDHAAGFTGAFAILAALEAQERTGEGQHVDIAQLEVGAYLVGSALTDLLANGREAQPWGNVDPYAPFVVNDVFAAADGEVAVTVRDVDDERAAERVIGGPLAGLAAWLGATPARTAMERLQAAGVSAGRVQNGHHLFTDDEQLAARSFFGALHSDVFGERPVERFPAVFSRSTLEPYRAAPNYLGEHAFEILEELAGMDAEAVADAMADGRLG